MYGEMLADRQLFADVFVIGEDDDDGDAGNVQRFKLFAYRVKRQKRTASNSFSYTNVHDVSVRLSSFGWELHEEEKNANYFT